MGRAADQGRAEHARHPLPQFRRSIATPRISPSLTSISIGADAEEPERPGRIGPGLKSCGDPADEGQVTPKSGWDGARLSVWALLAATGVGALAYAGFIAAGKPDGLDELASVWIYHATLLLGSLACFARATLVRDQRLAWIAFGLGLLCWMAGDLYWTLAYSSAKSTPYPSPADAGYLAALPCFYVGIALLIKRRIGHFTLASWLDGAIGGLAAAALGSALLAPALVGLTNGNAAAVLANVAYPLGDILLIGFILGALVVSGFRGAGAFLAIAAGLITWTLADGVYLYQEATATYSGGWLDELWLVGALLIAAGAALTFTHRPRPRRVYSSSLVFPSLFGTVAIGVLVWDHFSPQHVVSVWLAVATLAAVIIRMGISFRENTTLMAALEADASTDSLTRLGNRRKLVEDLERALELGRDAQGSHAFALYDLDGFKLYNDTFGHPAGDSLLRRLGAKLAAAVEPGGRAYRLGGDEFCILVPACGGSVGRIVETGRSALTEQGEGFRVSASAGAVLISAEAAIASEVLRLADRRMYAEKAERSGRVDRQAHELLITILHDREPELTHHHEGVARLAVAVGRELRFDAEEIDVVRRAAEFHDIGKIAIPEGILRKPAPLDEIEWELMRTHTLVGERIIGTFPSMRPVARLVRSSHERWDGRGYPDRLAAEEIPLGARVISVCDAFDAMCSDRPYSPRRDERSALAEIRRGAGTQFDPDVVEAFLRIVDRVERVEPRRPAPAPIHAG
jgi:diguanylate cyclase (GGDEF)-like protein